MTEEDTIVDQLHPLERKVLPLLHKKILLSEVVPKSELQEVEVVRAIQWLQGKELITTEKIQNETVVLEKYGSVYKEKGMPEVTFLKSLEGVMTIPEIEKKSHLSREEINVCIGLLKRKTAIITEKKENQLGIAITEVGKQLIQDNDLQPFLKSLPKNIEECTETDKILVKELLQRQSIISIQVKKDIHITLTDLGRKIIHHNLKEESIERVTQSMLKKKAWKNKTFRKYDVTTDVPNINIGKKHFENQVIDYINSIWIELGFKEMQGTQVQSAFWDLDMLFVPQDHPAREMQDTFYIKKYEAQLNSDLVKKCKKIHEEGGTTGSKGWGGHWDEKIAKKQLLRTHTTAVAAHTLHGLKKEDVPTKFFYVGKVFRNEVLDWKHSFEFYQVEGIVIDENANLTHLKGYLKEFYAKMGYPKVRMRPSHFPYTEPSMEVDAWNEEKQEWVELGGAGIYRPEVVIPLLGKDVPVLAWGLGLGRMFSFFDIKDIRDINKNDVTQLRTMKRWMK